MKPAQVDELARKAGQAVRERADHLEPRWPGPSEVRRRHRIRRSVAVAALVAVVAGALVVFAQVRPSSVPVIGEGDQLADDDGLPDYSLDYEDAVLAREEPVRASTSDVALWHRPETGEYLSLVVRPGLGEGQPEPAGIGPVSAVDAIPGKAWVTDPSSAATPPDARSIRMWWTRPDSDVWLLSAYWYGQSQPGRDEQVRDLIEWAQRIGGAPDGTYELAGAGFDLIAFDRAGTFTTDAKVWRLRGEEITLLVGEGVAVGHSNLLALGAPERTTVDGQTAWLVQEPGGRTSVGWSVQNGARWVKLDIPPGLNESVDRIIDSVHR